MYQISGLTNASQFPGNQPATITIELGDDSWEEAYQNWLQGYTPTASPEWKKGADERAIYV